ncbi:MAG: hypothetical protein WCO89_00195 [Syntrophus sp. (in: bacteria)]
MEKHEELGKFEAVTIWNGEDGYVVNVIMPGFNDFESARAFANSEGSERYARKLVLDEDGSLVLVLNSGEAISLTDEDIIVSKLREEMNGKPVVNCDDFELVQIPISSFSSISGLCRGFEGIAYGVNRDGVPCSC